MLSLSFISISLLALYLFYYATGKNKMVLFLGSIWSLLLGIFSSLHYFENSWAWPPRFLFVPFGALLLCFLIYRNIDLQKTNTRLLIAVHTLRLPIELVIYQLFVIKLAPKIMTFKGCNFDILVGISAILLLFYLCYTSRKIPNYLLLIWNGIGLLFLFTIVGIAVLSAPLPIQKFGFEQPNIAVFKFPYVFLPGLVVPLVALSNILTIQICRQKTQPT